MPQHQPRALLSSYFHNTSCPSTSLGLCCLLTFTTPHALALAQGSVVFSLSQHLMPQQLSQHLMPQHQPRALLSSYFHNTSCPSTSLGLCCLLTFTTPHALALAQGSVVFLLSQHLMPQHQPRALLSSYFHNTSCPSTSLGLCCLLTFTTPHALALAQGSVVFLLSQHLMPQHQPRALLSSHFHNTSEPQHQCQGMKCCLRRQHPHYTACQGMPHALALARAQASQGCVVLALVLGLLSSQHLMPRASTLAQGSVVFLLSQHLMPQHQPRALLSSHFHRAPRPQHQLGLRCCLLTFTTLGLCCLHFHNTDALALAGLLLTFTTPHALALAQGSVVFSLSSKTSTEPQALVARALLSSQSHKTTSPSLAQGSVVFSLSQHLMPQLFVLALVLGLLFVTTTHALAHRAPHALALAQGSVVFSLVTSVVTRALHSTPHALALAQGSVVFSTPHALALAQGTSLGLCCLLTFTTPHALALAQGSVVFSLSQHLMPQHQPRALLSSYFHNTSCPSTSLGLCCLLTFTTPHALALAQGSVVFLLSQHLMPQHQPRALLSSYFHNTSCPSTSLGLCCLLTFTTPHALALAQGSVVFLLSQHLMPQHQPRALLSSYFHNTSCPSTSLGLCCLLTFTTPHALALAQGSVVFLLSQHLMPQHQPRALLSSHFHNTSCPSTSLGLCCLLTFTTPHALALAQGSVVFLLSQHLMPQHQPRALLSSHFHNTSCPSTSLGLCCLLTFTTPHALALAQGSVVFLLSQHLMPQHQPRALLSSYFHNTSCPSTSLGLCCLLTFTTPHALALAQGSVVFSLSQHLMPQHQPRALLSSHFHNTSCPSTSLGLCCLLTFTTPHALALAQGSVVFSLSQHLMPQHQPRALLSSHFHNTSCPSTSLGLCCLLTFTTPHALALAQGSVVFSLSQHLMPQHQPRALLSSHFHNTSCPSTSLGLCCLLTFTTPHALALAQGSVVFLLSQHLMPQHQPRALLSSHFHNTSCPSTSLGLCCLLTFTTPHALALAQGSVVFSLSQHLMPQHQPRALLSSHFHNTSCPSTSLGLCCLLTFTTPHALALAQGSVVFSLSQHLMPQHQPRAQGSVVFSLSQHLMPQHQPRALLSSYFHNTSCPSTSLGLCCLLTFTTPHALALAQGSVVFSLSQHLMPQHQPRALLSSYFHNTSCPSTSLGLCCLLTFTTPHALALAQGSVVFLLSQHLMPQHQPRALLSSYFHNTSCPSTSLGLCCLLTFTTTHALALAQGSVVFLLSQHLMPQHQPRALLSSYFHNTSCPSTSLACCLLRALLLSSHFHNTSCPSTSLGLCCLLTFTTPHALALAQGSVVFSLSQHLMPQHQPRALLSSHFHNTSCPSTSLGLCCLLTFTTPHALALAQGSVVFLLSQHLMPQHQPRALLSSYFHNTSCPSTSLGLCCLLTFTTPHALALAQGSVVFLLSQHLMPQHQPRALLSSHFHNTSCPSTSLGLCCLLTFTTPHALALAQGSVVFLLSQHLMPQHQPRALLSSYFHNTSCPSTSLGLYCLLTFTIPHALALAQGSVVFSLSQHLMPQHQLGLCCLLTFTTPHALALAQGSVVFSLSQHLMPQHQPRALLSSYFSTTPQHLMPQHQPRALLSSHFHNTSCPSTSLGLCCLLTFTTPHALALAQPVVFLLSQHLMGSVVFSLSQHLMPQHQPRALLSSYFHNTSCPSTSLGLCCLLTFTTPHALALAQGSVVFLLSQHLMPQHQPRALLSSHFHNTSCPSTSLGLCCLLTFTTPHALALAQGSVVFLLSQHLMPQHQPRALLSSHFHNTSCPSTSLGLCCLLTFTTPHALALAQGSVVFLHNTFHNTSCCLLTFTTPHALALAQGPSTSLGLCCLLLSSYFHNTSCPSTSLGLCCLLTFTTPHALALAQGSVVFLLSQQLMPQHQPRALLSSYFHNTSCPSTSLGLCCLLTFTTPHALALAQGSVVFLLSQHLMPQHQPRALLSSHFHNTSCPSTSLGLCCLLTFTTHALALAQGSVVFLLSQHLMPQHQPRALLSSYFHNTSCPSTSLGLCCLLTFV